MTAPKYKRLSPENRAAELVQAGLKVLAKSGLTGFTIDNICKASGASRGLVGHHFGNKDGLLAACYAAAYAPLLTGLEQAQDLPDLLHTLLSDDQPTPGSLNIWLALWAEIATNPTLRTEHQKHYDRYHATLAAALTAFAETRQKPIKADTIATSLIALLDGLWVEICISPTRMTPPLARQAVHALLEPHLGPLS